MTQGLAQRLLNTKAADNPAYVKFPGGYVDVARSRELWGMYKAPAALLKQGRWRDEASVSIPAAYAQTGQFLAYGLAARGDTLAADTVMRKVRAMLKAAKLGN